LRRAHAAVGLRYVDDWQVEIRKNVYTHPRNSQDGAQGDGNNANNDSSNGIGTGPRSTDSDTAATEVQHVQNANGNMPDTTNSINIGTTTPNGKDSSKQH